MPDKDVQFLSAEQARYLVEMAEQARTRLSEFAGYDVGYDSTALQLLDEWIERVSERAPKPPHELRVLWIAFLGEAFRRRFEGEWVAHAEKKGSLAVLCPATDGGLQTVDVAKQVRQRIEQGFSNSLALFYVQESIQLKQRQVT
jgi:hypothetical protein